MGFPNGVWEPGRVCIFPLGHWQQVREADSPMPFVALTRLRVRSLRFLPSFFWQAFRASRQARRAPGNLGVELHVAARLAFWTMTAWQDEAAMNAYRIAPPHLHAMPKLLEWCDEASVAHWNQDSPDLPSWADAEKRMAEAGRLSKVNHPSPDHLAGRLRY
jgi:heme-degrading monooxygenase HmoA